MSVNSEVAKGCLLEHTSIRGQGEEEQITKETQKENPEVDGKADEGVFRKASRKEKCIKEERGDQHVKCCC